MPSNLLKVPSRLPPNYVARTLQRIALNESELARLTRAQLEAYAHELEQLERMVDADPVRFFRPNPGGQFDFMTCDDPALQGLFFFAGNKTGKTTGACIIAGEYACGRPLWTYQRPHDPVRWSAFHRTPPIRIAHFTEDFGSHDETIVPTYLSWLPAGEITAVKRNPSGNMVQLPFKNGSVVFLRTYDQGYDKAEGKDYDLVICDEPPPRDVHTAILRGLVATSGRYYIAATLLKEAWLYDESQLAHNRIFSADIYENRWLSRQAIENFSSSLTEDERQIRVFGRPSTLTGSIYPEFADKYPHIVAPKDWRELWDAAQDRAWPIVMGIDPHERKPLYCMWAYLTPGGGLLWFDRALVPSGSTEAIFKELAIIEAEHATRARIVVMDPNRGKARQLGNVSWQETFEEHEYEVLLGDDNLGLGHGAVHDLLHYDTDGDGKVTRPPRMQFMENLRGKGGPIAQLIRYTWDDWARGRRIEKAVKEKPRELNKDFPDVVRYVAVAFTNGDISYEDLIRGDYETVTSMPGRDMSKLYG